MKKVTFIFAILMATAWAKAQTLDSIPHHGMGHMVNPSTIMELRSGDILGGTLLADTKKAPSPTPVGYMVHSVSRHGAMITDSLFLAYDRLPCQITIRNPFGTDNILAEMVNDVENNCFNLRIRHFDDDLNLDAANEILIPLADFIANGGWDGMTLNPQGDLVLAYYDRKNNYANNTYFAQIGLDGAVKQSKTFVPETMPMNRNHYGPKVFSESPLQYCYWGTHYNGDNLDLNCFVLDSVFNIVESYTIPSYYHSYNPSLIVQFGFDYEEKMLGMENGDFLIASRNDETTNTSHDQGCAVLKFDKDFHLKAYAKFLSIPYLQYCHGNRPIGLEKSRDGNIYFAYYTQEPEYYYGQWYGQVAVVKMDYDLNIIWQRFCLEPQGYGREGGCMTVLEDNGVAILGNNVNNNGSSEIFYLIVNDDYDSMEEQGFIVRPYAYWPNPVQDELHLQYSPDITPKQIELYDLHGRLVKTQHNGLEILNLEGLAAGTYTMRVSLEGVKVFSDKVVKE